SLRCGGSNVGPATVAQRIIKRPVPECPCRFRLSSGREVPRPTPLLDHWFRPSGLRGAGRAREIETHPRRTPSASASPRVDWSLVAGLEAQGVHVMQFFTTILTHARSVLGGRTLGREDGQGTVE